MGVVNGESNLDSFIMGFRLGANFTYDTFVSEESPFTDLLKEAYPIADLPTAISIDGFKGNTWGEKYQCILTDPVNKVVLDILPERYKPYLTKYFKQFSKEKRNEVTYFVSDMWRTYADISDVWFKNATQIVDKYHWIRQAIWAFENVRKEEQKKLGPELRKYFKRSKSLLIKRFDSLEEEQKQQVNVMLYYSVNISRAYFYKEQKDIKQ